MPSSTLTSAATTRARSAMNRRAAAAPCPAAAPVISATFPVSRPMSHQLLGEWHQDRLQFGVRLERALSALAADHALFETTERQVRLDLEPVDPDRAGAQSSREPERPARV